MGERPFLNLYLATSNFKARSKLLQCWNEVWSILGALEVPYTPEKITLTKIIYGLPLLLLKFFDLALPTRGYSTELSQFY